MMASTKSVEKVPKWLKAEIFEQLLREIVPNFRRVKELKAEPGLGPGENYATIMLRVGLLAELKDGQTKWLTFMMKVAHESEKMNELLKEQNVFEIERNVFQEVVPEMEQLLREAGVSVQFGAKCYTINAPDNYVLLEDLKPAGFKNANRFDGLDQTHTECVLRKLAQWHAASATRVAKKGPYGTHLTDGFFNEKRIDMITAVFAGMGKYLLEALPQYKNHESYIAQIQKLQTKIGQKLLKMGQQNTTEFYALNHGDCWCNNIMFQYDTAGRIAQTYLVDYQMCKYGTVAQDLLYFLLSSTKLEDKLSKFDYYVRYYHEHLIENLQLLKYPKAMPSLKSIHESIIKHGIWGYTTVIGVMGAVLLDPTESAHVDNFLDESEEGAKFKRLMYNNRRYKQHAEVILPWLLNRGALE